MNIIIRLGYRLRIDGEFFTCVSVEETSHSDFGVGPVVKSVVCTMVNENGFKVKISEETEE